MILDQFKLDGKVAIVTGGARGLWRGMATRLPSMAAGWHDRINKEVKLWRA